MDSLFRWIIAGTMLVGSPFVLIAGCEALETTRELTRSVRARGTVVENRLVIDHRDGVEEHAYQPVVEFRDTSGRPHRFTDPAGSLPPDYSSGETVPIAFDATDPSHARIVSWKRLWLVPTLLAVVGMLPTAVCLIIFRRLSSQA
jgi:hypothetical protein